MRIGTVLKHGGAAVVLVFAMVFGVLQPVFAADIATLTPQSVTMTEGETQEVTIDLTEPIIAPGPDPGFVEIYIENGATSRLELGAGSAHFDAGEWNSVKTFSITAIDDGLFNGDQEVQLSIYLYSNSEFYNEYETDTTITVLDNEATPTATITSPKAGQNIPAGSLMVTGTGTAGYTIAVVIDGQAKGTTTVDEDGNWNLLVPSVAEGSHDIVANIQTSDHYAYMANAYTGSIDVVSLERHAYVYEITGAESVGATYNTHDGIVYSASNRDEDCKIMGYDPLTYEVVKQVSVPSPCRAISLALSPDGMTAYMLYIETSNNYGMMKLNLTNNSSSGGSTPEVDGLDPSGIAVTPANNQLWIRTTDGIEIYDTNFTHLDTIDFGSEGSAWRQNIVFNAAGTRAYTANQTDGTVAVINTSTLAVITEVEVAENVNMVALTPDESRLYIAASSPASAIYVMNTSNNTVVDSFEVDQGLPPESLAIADDGQWVVGDDHGTGAIFFGNIANGPQPTGTIYAPGGGSYYTSTSNFVSPTLTNVLGATTTTPFSATAYTVPNTGFKSR